MDNKNATMILKGLNSNSNHDLIDCKYEQPYSNCDINNPRHYGMPFEAKAALEMINNFRLSMLGKKLLQVKKVHLRIFFSLGSTRPQFSEF